MRHPVRLDESERPLSRLPLLMPDWPTPAGVNAMVTLRNGGVSQPPFAGSRGEGGLNLGFHTGDDPAAVTENRRRVQAHVGSRPIAWLAQVHGARVVTAFQALSAPEPLEADAVITDQPELVCAIMVADCLPVVLSDSQGQVVGAAHAGWRGLHAGVLERTAEAMSALMHGGSLQAWLGPAIGPAAFEVGVEVRDAFMEAARPAERDACAAAFVPSTAPGHGTTKYFGSLRALARIRLARHGVRCFPGEDADVEISGRLCTFTGSDRFFSYRRDARTGRFAVLIWRSGKP